MKREIHFTNAQSIRSDNYELGRCDERIAVDSLLSDIEHGAGRATHQARLREYRAATARSVVQGRERGWYP